MIYSRTLANKDTYHSDYLDEQVIDLLGASWEIPEEYTFSVIKSEPGFECRPDLISKVLYNDEIYYDDILKLNGPGNPFEFSDEQYIMAPSYDSMNSFVRVPSKLWSDQAIKYKPKPKARTEKRRPNQAVVGDRRFNIDSLSKIVVY